jgi:hypothetical protein
MRSWAARETQRIPINSLFLSAVEISRLASAQMILPRRALRRGRECHRTGDDHRDRDRWWKGSGEVSHALWIAEPRKDFKSGPWVARTFHRR